VGRQNDDWGGTVPANMSLRAIFLIRNHIIFPLWKLPSLFACHVASTCVQSIRHRVRTARVAGLKNIRVARKLYLYIVVSSSWISEAVSRYTSDIITAVIPSKYIRTTAYRRRKPSMRFIKGRWLPKTVIGPNVRPCCVIFLWRQACLCDRCVTLSHNILT